ncbi:MAG: transketolase [Nitrospiraceae bacterium]|nr:transketolase [Nitrospiraceae bacterium]
MAPANDLDQLARLIRYYSLVSTTEAGSGHPTSSLSAADLMTGLLFGGTFRFNINDPLHPNNDRLIFSKGHASPLFYSLWLAAGAVTEGELMTLRKFGSPFEGHPTPAFRYTEAATGSLGQGLSIGVGMALNAQHLDRLPYRTYVLLGDSEMAEGSVWEAMEIAAYYKLGSLTAILDVNRLGQRGETMYGHDLEVYRRRAEAFGWEPLVIDGHDLAAIVEAFRKAAEAKDRPVMIVAKTLKGKGISFIEDRNGWHGKALSREELARALPELGPVNTALRGEIELPENRVPNRDRRRKPAPLSYDPAKPVSTRRAYGNALARIAPFYPEMVALDGEVSNSTFAEVFKKEQPDRFFEMFIAEQNMAGAALGLALRGKIPFVSSFAAFLTRAHDQIRMAQYSNGNVKFCGSHAGVSIGEDGSSQMGLEDLAMFRAMIDSVVLYPSDAVSAERMVELMAEHRGVHYLRTTRMDTPILYRNDEKFWIGGSKVLRSKSADIAAVVTAGITVHEALKAYEVLKQEDMYIRVIDLYSIKPVDVKTLMEAAEDIGVLITVEDHFPEGGLGNAVRTALANRPVPVYSLAVNKLPRSGKPGELIGYEDVSAEAIVRTVKGILS